MIPNHIALHDIMQQGVSVRHQPVSCFIASGLSPSFCIDMIRQPDGSTWVVLLSEGEDMTAYKAATLEALNRALYTPGDDDAA